MIETAKGSLAENGLMIVVQFSAGPSLGSTLVRSIVDNGDDHYVFVQYLPINRVLSNTEYKAALRSVQLFIQLLKPRFIMSLDDNYMKYMSPEVYEGYKDKFIVANKGLSSVGFPSCSIIQTMSDSSYQSLSPVYILRDDNVAHIESSKLLSACLVEKGHQVVHYQANTLAKLKNDLLDINSKPPGFLISLVDTVSDTEYNRTVGLDAINRLILKVNKNHVDVGFVRASVNLSVLIVPSLDNLGTDSRWEKLRTTPKIYVSVDRLDHLGASLIYKNMFQDINGTLDK